MEIIEGGLDKKKECSDDQGNLRNFFKLTLEIDKEGIQKIIKTEEQDRVGKIAVSFGTWVLIQGSGVETMIRKQRNENRDEEEKKNKKKNKKSRKTSNTKKTKTGKKASPPKKKNNNGSK